MYCTWMAQYLSGTIYFAPLCRKWKWFGFVALLMLARVACGRLTIWEVSQSRGCRDIAWCLVHKQTLLDLKACCIWKAFLCSQCCMLQIYICKVTHHCCRLTTTISVDLDLCCLQQGSYTTLKSKDIFLFHL